MTAQENSRYGLAGPYFAGMMGEQALFALTAGQSLWARGSSVFEIVADTSTISQTSNAVPRHGYYDAKDLKFSEYYYNRPWNTGR